MGPPSVHAAPNGAMTDNKVVPDYQVKVSSEREGSGQRRSKDDLWTARGCDSELCNLQTVRGSDLRTMRGSDPQTVRGRDPRTVRGCYPWAVQGRVCELAVRGCDQVRVHCSSIMVLTLSGLRHVP